MSKPAELADIPFEETHAVEPVAPPFGDVFSKDTERQQVARLHWFRHTKDGLLNTIFHTLLKPMPLDFVSGFGKAMVPLGRWSYRNKVFPKRIARNFHALTPGKWTSDAEEATGLRNWWNNISRTISEFCIVNRLWDQGRIEIVGLENFEAASQLGGPVIFTTVHLATWEAVLAVNEQGVAPPNIATYQPEPNRFKNRIVSAIRKERNQYIFPPGQRSAFHLHRLMKTGRYSLTIFIDEVRNKQIHVPFFGRQAPDGGNAIVAVKLANTSGGVLVPTYLSRKESARFQLTILPPLKRPEGTEKYDIVRTLKALNEVFEPIVLENIEEWYMLGELRLPKDFEKGDYARKLAQQNAKLIEN